MRHVCETPDRAKFIFGKSDISPWTCSIKYEVFKFYSDKVITKSKIDDTHTDSPKAMPNLLSQRNRNRIETCSIFNWNINVLGLAIQKTVEVPMECASFESHGHSILSVLSSAKPSANLKEKTSTFKVVLTV